MLALVTIKLNFNRTHFTRNLQLYRDFHFGWFKMGSSIGVDRSNLEGVKLKETKLFFFDRYFYVSTNF